MSITHAELVERIAKAMLEMEGEDLADLYNREFGDGMKYIGDSLYEQDENADESDTKVSLWLRIGDSDSYTPHGDDLDGAIQQLKDYGVIGPIDDWVRGGFTTADFGGENYISLYWGDRKSNHKHDLYSNEKKKVEKALKN